MTIQRKYVAELNNEERHVEILKKHDDGVYDLRVGAREVSVNPHFLGQHDVSLIIDGRSYDVVVERVGDINDTLDGRVAVKVQGRVIKLDILEERRRRMKALSGDSFAGSGAQIESPMPGKVLRLSVEEGDEVAEGESVVVVEAMKMENVLRAPCPGKITSIKVRAGDTVDSGDILVEISSMEEEDEAEKG